MFAGPIDPIDAEDLSDDLLILTEKDMGGSDTSFAICDLLVELFTDLFEQLERPMKVGGNLRFQFRQNDETGQVTPDVYVLADEPPEDRDLGSWKPWEHGGKVPALAIEVVSRNARKDYTLDTGGMIARYEELGAAEVVRYDPLWHTRHRGRRRLLTHWVRTPAGVLEEQALPQANLVKLHHLGIWLVHTGPKKLRLGIGAPGSMTLWPTRKERLAEAAKKAKAEAERAAAEAERAAAEAERAAAEAERAAAEAERADRAEQELQALREELARLRLRT